MASSPEMEPPGFELITKPPSSELPPSQIESLNPPTSPDEAPPGFENPNAWMPGSANHTGDPETEVTETVNQPMSGAGPHVSEPHLSLSESEVEVDIMTGTMHPFQLHSTSSDTKTLESLLDPPKIGDGLMETYRLSEVLSHPETEIHIKERDFKPVLKPETDIQGYGASFERQIALPPPAPVFKSLVPESVSESLVSLPPSPPPLPSVSESIVPESSCENLDPLPSLPPPPPPASIVCVMTSSPVLNSECDNLNKNMCQGGLTRDEILTEHETAAAAQPPLAPQEIKILGPAMLPPPPPSLSPQLKCELVVSSVPQMTEMRQDYHRPLKEETQEPSSQEMETYLCSHGNGKPDVLSFETGPFVNEITAERPRKKSRNMHETQGQMMPEACLPEVEKNSLVSETPEMGLHEEEDMEQIDMDMSDDETLDRSPTDVGPPGSDARDSESLEEPPPGYNTIDQTSQMELISQDALSGMGQMICGNCHELICYPHGALHVLCTCCQTINLVLEACQVGTITCGQCSVLLMYPFGAPSVRCSFCRYVTEIGAHNMRPPLSVQQGDGCPTLDVQLIQSSWHIIASNLK